MTHLSVVTADGESESHWLRVGEAARALSVGEKRIRQLADSGALETIRTSLGRLISPQSIERYKRSHPGRYT